MIQNLAGLTPEEKRDYEKDGFVVRAACLSRQQVVELRDAVECAAAKALSLCNEGNPYWLDGKRFVDVGHITIQFEHAPESNTIRVIEPVHELDAKLDALIDDPRIVAPMRDILGTPHIAMWTNKLNLKRAREGSGFGWHQDSPYWMHDSDHIDLLPNVMVTLDDADVTNGCFKVIRGSHRQGCLPGTDDGTQLGGFYTDPGCFDAASEVNLEVPAGSLIFFSPHIVHGSGPNPSDTPRRALVLTYQPGDFPALKSRQVRNVASI
ncbi:MAG: phytanoyl-CoA dioxygenase family protein [Pseudomonadales bacterium]|nr:phytanoyl-CoA dioxygenase family protein [Pseudomonadales bacterium]